MAFTMTKNAMCSTTAPVGTLHRSDSRPVWVGEKEWQVLWTAGALWPTN